MSLWSYLKRKLRPPYVPPRLIPMDPYEQKILDELRRMREDAEADTLNLTHSQITKDPK